MAPLAHAPRSLAALLLLAGCGEDLVDLTRPPTAFAGFDQAASVGSEVALDGSQSFDPDGDPLAFTWHLVAGPEGSAARLDGADEPLTLLVPDLPGTYVVELAVSDGALEDRDLVAIECARTSTAPEPLRLSVAPGSCNLSFDTLPTGACAGNFGAELRALVSAAPATAPEDLSVEWAFVRLPPGLSEADLQATMPRTPTDPMTFLPRRPGNYWVQARLLGRRAASAPAYGAVRVHPPEVMIDALPVPDIEGPRAGRVRERLLLDGRGSTETATTTRLRWSFFVDPSDGTASLSDRATGCPPDRCRIFVPTREGTYVVRLEAATATATSAPALWTIEVTP